MYNHYIPQSDGSYRRSAQPDQRRPTPPPKPKPESKPEPTPAPECPPTPPKPVPASPCPPASSPGNVLDFFRKLLPRGLDTADLMIVFLLLLMNKDDEGSLSPILTLALYFLL